MRKSGVPRGKLKESRFREREPSFSIDSERARDAKRADNKRKMGNAQSQGLGDATPTRHRATMRPIERRPRVAVVPGSQITRPLPLTRLIPLRFDSRLLVSFSPLVYLVRSAVFRAYGSLRHAILSLLNLRNRSYRRALFHVYCRSQYV